MNRHTVSTSNLLSQNHRSTVQLLCSACQELSAVPETGLEPRGNVCPHLRSTKMVRLNMFGLKYPVVFVFDKLLRISLARVTTKAFESLSFVQGSRSSSGEMVVHDRRFQTMIKQLYCSSMFFNGKTVVDTV